MTTETNTPNEANLLRWVRALESGEYKQGQNTLRQPQIEDDTFCCLGVACDVAAKDIGGKWSEQGADFIVTRNGDQTHLSDAHLPVEVADWLGIPTELRSETFGLDINIYLGGRDSENLATNLNDTQGQSFEVIAARVRETFNLPTKERDERILAWIEALESGEYAQGTGYLRTRTDRYCCLGVACTLAEKDGVGEWSGTPNTDGVYTFDCKGDKGRFGVLPDPVADWLGVDCDPMLSGSPATVRNDTHRQNFAEIAAAARVEFGFPPKA